MTGYRAGAPLPDFDGTQACAQVDTDLFFPDGAPGHKPAAAERARYQTAVQAAKAICQPCKFRDPCLAYAVDRPDVHGIWGGTTEHERAQMRRGTRKGHRMTPEQRALRDAWLSEMWRPCPEIPREIREIEAMKRQQDEQREARR